MTEGTMLEPWLPNGFPPPSFVVETERITVSSGPPPPQNRLLIGGALLGAVLLVLGLILMATSGGGGKDDTALRTAPDTGATSTLPPLSFPPATDFEGSFLVPDETVPLPTLPAPQTPIFLPAPAPAPAPAATPAPATTKAPPPPPPPPPTTTSTSTSTSTTSPPPPPPAPLTIRPAEATYRVQGPNFCTEDWKIRALVSAGLPIVRVDVKISGVLRSMVRVAVDASGRETWELTRPAVAAMATETFQIVAATKDREETTASESVSC